MRRRPAGTWRLRGAARAAAAIAAPTARVPVAISAVVVTAVVVAAAVIAALPAATAATPASAAQVRSETPQPRPVVLVGIAGLRWTDVSARATPALWRLAGDGSPGALVVRAVLPHTCAVDDWLTLNAGARAKAQHANKGPCPPIPPPAAVPSIAAYNQQFHYNTHWGLLASAARNGGCVTAAGPGAALALAGRQGHAPQQVPRVSRSVFATCPLTVVDLGALPDRGGRGAAVRDDDAELARIAAAMPRGGLLVVAGLADGGAPHLRPVVVSGRGYRSGLLATASTRQPGLVQLTDLTAAILTWRGQPGPDDLVGSPLTRADRGSLAAAVRGLTGQDTAAQVYGSSAAWFFAAYAVGDGVVFGVITLACLGAARGRRRRACARIAGAFCGAIVPASFLASAVSWWLLPHPAIVLYALTAAWTAVIGAVAIAGPWRRDPFGPPGLVGLVTVVVIGLDVTTGSRLQIGTPFGLSTLEAGRFYGVGNNALGPYAAAGMLAAAWVACVAARRSFRPAPADGVAAGRAATGRAGSGPGRGRRARRDGVAAVAAVGAFTVIASGWPGFGSKFGGTVAMVPGFILLGLCAAGVRLTARRGAVIAVSGVAVVAAFALVSYVAPVTGHSHIGAFVGDLLHGGAGGVLQRKISSNVGSLTITPYSPLVPLVVAGLGLLLARPRWFGATWLPGTWAREPLLRPAMAAIWVVSVLGWLADDSGVTVAAAALPFALPLAIAVHASAIDRQTRGSARPSRRAPRGAPPRPAPGYGKGQAGELDLAGQVNPKDP